MPGGREKFSGFRSHKAGVFTTPVVERLHIIGLTIVEIPKKIWREGFSDPSASVIFI